MADKKGYNWGFKWDPSQWKYDTQEGGFPEKKGTGMDASVPDNMKSDEETAEPVLEFKPPKTDRDVEMDFMQGRPVGDADIELESGDWAIPPEEKETKSDPEPKPPTPDARDAGPDMEGFYKQRIDELSKDIEGFRQDATELDPELSRELAKAQAVYQQSKDDLASKEMWEGIIHGLGYLVAGVVGHQTGLNLGGLKFDKKNWDARRNQIMNELQTSQSNAFRKMDMQQRKIAENRSQRMAEFQMNESQLKRLADENKDQWYRDYMERKLADERQFKKWDTAVKALKAKNTGAAELKDLNRYFENVDRALGAYKEKNNSKNFANVKAAMEEANRRARDAGLPQPYNTAELTAETKGIFIDSRPDYEDITTRYIQQLNEGNTEEPEKDAPPPGYRFMQHPQHGRVIQNINNPKDIKKWQN